MNKTNPGYLLLACFSVVLAARPAHADSNGGTGPVLDDPPLVVGADWFATESSPPAFFWGSGDNAPNSEGPFTFNALTPVRLDVTDDFNVGDRFEVFDFGASIGLTSVPVGIGSGEVGPEAAFHNPAYSSGSFFLGPGNHAITFAVIENPFNQGRGYLRAFPVPEPSAITLGALAFAALLVRGARSRMLIDRHA